MSAFKSVQLFWFILASFDVVIGLDVVLEIPEYVVRGQSTTLECSYTLSANEKLSSIKFYKDGHEFSRYTPAEIQKQSLFPLPGLNIKVQSDLHNKLQLDKVDLESSGFYRCEVTLESPILRRNSPTIYMTVGELPISGPQVAGARRQYSIGEEMNVNCSSSPSRPAASLTWYINREQASSSLLRKYPTVVAGQDLESAVLGLQFKVKARHYLGGVFELRCSSSVGTLYQKSYDLAFVGDGVTSSQSENELNPTLILGKPASSLMNLAWCLLSSMNSVMLLL